VRVIWDMDVLLVGLAPTERPVAGMLLRLNDGHP
jgi:hypothetical protein